MLSINPTDVLTFVNALQESDHGTSNFEGWPGGTIHKVIRWGFEKQGLFQPPGIQFPVLTEGQPPPVDVYLDDGRHGEYMPYLADPDATVERYLVKSFESSLPETRLLLLGGWAETGRLAALAQDTDALVRLVRKDPGSDSIDEIAPLMTSIRQALADGDLGADDFAALATAFAGIIGQLSD